MVPFPNQINPVNNFSPHFCKSLSNIIPAMSRFSDWSLLFRFFDKKFVYISHFSCVLYDQPIHPPWLGHHNNVWWSVQIMDLLITRSSPASCHFLSLRFKYSTHNLCNIFFLRWGTVSHPPNPQTGISSLVSCTIPLIQYIRRYHPISGGRLLHPQPEDASWLVRGTHLILCVYLNTAFASIIPKRRCKFHLCTSERRSVLLTQI